MIPLTAATGSIDGRLLAQQAADVIGRGSKSFAAATRLFPAEMRGDVMLLYAWCRHCDDVIDGQQLGRGCIQTASDEVLRQIRQRSLAALAGQLNECPRIKKVLRIRRW
ncbi:MAG: squalene/phytoene synthase family protein [Wenzhouxiangella sp.]|nr:squalene/phytoene synthase family protein [Wenzhouxiangella sp.]MCH8478812.1 squalene/phytoene synthase family protein [Wenzhouxiangella sp.]